LVDNNTCTIAQFKVKMAGFSGNSSGKGSILELVAEDILKLLIATVIGSVIGAEREYRDKSAGFRTLIFICVGSTLFTMLSLKMSNNSDPARIAAQIVTGVGFLGAGSIVRDHRRIVGLTTAAMIWLSAALGMSVGSGNYLLGIAGAGVSLVVLLLFPYMEQWIDSMSGTEHYEVVCAYAPGRYEEILAQVRAARLKVISSKCNKLKESIIISMVVQGSPRSQATLAAQFLDDASIKEFRH
jgi:putative Mg2+ transporter-C (MgtC) family protein